MSAPKVASENMYRQSSDGKIVSGEKLVGSGVLVFVEGDEMVADEADEPAAKEAAKPANKAVTSSKTK